MNHHKIIPAIVIILAVAVGGIIGFIISQGDTVTVTLPFPPPPPALPSPPSDEMVDWKTYRNEEYGFEVRYPANSIFEDRGASVSGEIRFFSTIGDIGTRDLSSPLLFLRIQKAQYQTLNDYKPSLMTNPGIFHDSHV